MKCSTHWLYGNQTTPHNVAIATPRDTVWLPHNLCVDHYVYYGLSEANAHYATRLGQTFCTNTYVTVL